MFSLEQHVNSETLKLQPTFNAVLFREMHMNKENIIYSFYLCAHDIIQVQAATSLTRLFNAKWVLLLLGNSVLSGQ